MPADGAGATVMAVFKFSPNKRNLQMVSTPAEGEKAKDQAQQQQQLVKPQQQQQQQQELANDQSKVPINQIAPPLSTVDSPSSPRSKALLLQQRERLLRKYSPSKMQQQQKWKQQRLSASGSSGKKRRRKEIAAAAKVPSAIRFRTLVS